MSPDCHMGPNVIIIVLMAEPKWDWGISSGKQKGTSPHAHLCRGLQMLL